MYVVKRLAALIPVVFIVSLVVFGLLYITPGDPAALIGGFHATEADLQKIRESLGLDKPVLIRFWEWNVSLLQGDLGKSIYSNRPVLELIQQRMGATFSLMLLTMILSVIISVPLGALAAWKRDRWADRCAMVFAVAGFSIPSFVIAYLLAFIFAVELKWFPVQGYSPLSNGFIPFLRSLFLPAATLAVVFTALLTRVTRSAMLEALGQDYIRTARAKGLGEGSVLFVHALRNASVPIVTVVGIGMGLLIGGAVVTEIVFAIPGLGRLTADAVLRRDFPVIQGVVLFLSLTYVLVNLLVDLTYFALDPRIRR